MSGARHLLAAAGLLLAAGALPATGAECPATGAEAALGTRLPRLEQAVGSGAPVGIVLVGMGGSRPGGLEGPFAQTLARMLERGLPGREVRVQIIPTAGLLAKDAAERVRRAVAETEPALVIWRTGMSDALAMTDPAKFAHTVRRVAEWLSVQETDLVLVDLAYLAGSAQESNYRRYVEALASVARGSEVAVFRRYAIMEAWSRLGTTPEAAQGEACLAEALAAAILRGAER